MATRKTGIRCRQNGLKLEEEFEKSSYTISIRMNASLAPGKYVGAVSGGVDSVSLLHLLQGQPGVKLIVAHFDHGIREDSPEDRRLVQDAARNYRLPFVYDTGGLGVGTSEATARTAR